MLSSAPFLASLPQDLAGKTASLVTVHGRYGNNALNGDWELGMTSNTSAPPQKQVDRIWKSGTPEPFTFSFTNTRPDTFTNSLNATFSIGGSGVQFDYGSQFASYEPNAIKIWASTATATSSLTINDLRITTPGVAGKTVFPGASIAVSQASGTVFQEIIIAGIDFQSVSGGTVTLEGNVTMQFGADPALRGSALQFHVIATHIPWVDLDVDSNNDGTIDRTNGRRGTDDRIEQSAPGKIIPVGGARAEMLVTLPAGRNATLEVKPNATDKLKFYTQREGGEPLAFHTFGPNDEPAFDMSLVPGRERVGATDSWTLWVEATGPSTTAGDLVFTLTGNSSGPPASDIVRATAVMMDIDVDSNNDGKIGEDDDAVEDVDAGDNANVGARVFQNIDDDDHNKTMDKNDGLFIKPGVEDLDLTEAVLGTSNLAVLGNPQQNAGNYRLWLGVPAGLNVFADRRRTPLTPDGTDGTWRYWNVAQDGSSTFPKKIFIEGLVIGEHEVIWQLCKPNAPGQNGPPQQSLSRDVVDISVEEMVFPTVDQRVANVYSKPTSQWDGFALKEEYPWIIEKPLVDFIKAKKPVGWLETTYKQPTGEANAPSLESRQTANNGSFTIEFEYEYDRSRGENGWVAANNQQKISFVANSGVKFGKNFSTEIALLDVRAMVDRATITTNEVTYTGLDAFDPRKGGGIVVDVDGVPAEGKVVVNDLTGNGREEIARLLTGVAYNRGYVGVTDAPNMPADKADRKADDYFQVLKAVYDREVAFEKQNGAPAGGSLKASYAGATSTLTISLNGQPTYKRVPPAPPLPDVGKVENLQLQSHWGSGVRFMNIKISD